MIYLYLFALVLGGVLLGTSILLGGHTEGADGDAGGGGGEDLGEADASAAGGADASVSHADAGSGDPNAGVESLLVAFLSFRFWTFFLTFFGLTGLVLDGFGLVGSEIVAGVLAIGMGLGCGAGAVAIMRRVRGDESNSAARTTDFVGKSGRVLVGFGPGNTGKVRLEVRGTSVDVLASPIDGSTFEAKEEVIVVEMDGTRARVARMTPDLLERISRP